MQFSIAYGRLFESLPSRKHQPTVSQRYVPILIYGTIFTTVIDILLIRIGIIQKEEDILVIYFYLQWFHIIISINIDLLNCGKNEP